MNYVVATFEFCFNEYICVDSDFFSSRLQKSKAEILKMAEPYLEDEDETCKIVAGKSYTIYEIYRTDEPLLIASYDDRNQAMKDYFDFVNSGHHHYILKKHIKCFSIFDAEEYTIRTQELYRDNEEVILPGPGLEYPYNFEF